MQTKGRPKSFNQDYVLEKGLRLFWRFGYDKVSTDMICRECGLSKPSLYNTFGSKEQFYIECFKTYNQVYSTALASFLTREADPIVGAEKLLSAAARQFQDLGFPAGCLAITGLIEVKGKSPLIDEQLKISQSAMLEVIESYFEARMVPGQKTPAKALGQFLIGQLFALAVFSRSHKELFNFEHFVQMSKKSLQALIA